MRNSTLYDTECLIYPGAYTPLVKEEQMGKEPKHLHSRKIISLSAKVTEMPDSYKVELIIPGAIREDFFVHAYGTVLSVSVMHREKERNKNKKSRSLEFNYDCFDRQIILPDNADTEFISAEYLSGILRLYIPKLIKPAKSRHTIIAVY